MIIFSYFALQFNIVQSKGLDKKIKINKKKTGFKIRKVTLEVLDFKLVI